MKNKQRGGLDPLITAALVVAVVVGGIVIWMLDNNQDDETADPIPVEPVTNFEECMSGLYSWEEIDGITYCYAPDGIVFTGES